MMEIDGGVVNRQPGAPGAKSVGCGEVTAGIACGTACGAAGSCSPACPVPVAIGGALCGLYYGGQIVYTCRTWND